MQVKKAERRVVSRGFKYLHIKRYSQGFFFYHGGGNEGLAADFFSMIHHTIAQQSLSASLARLSPADQPPPPFPRCHCPLIDYGCLLNTLHDGDFHGDECTIRAATGDR